MPIGRSLKAALVLDLTNGYMKNAVMKRVCSRKSYRESRKLPVIERQSVAERDRWNVTEDGLLSGVDEH